ncbi:MAG TPA: hypothetical protein PKD90_12690 [Phnomibacter sp.]|nr:hypothetical protein [Phnomibacter sp.]
MYLPHAGDMNYINAGSKAMYNAYAKVLSQFVKFMKGRVKALPTISVSKPTLKNA